MTFSADKSLNGKVKVSIEAKGASVYVYMMPNNFNTGVSDTIGILENNQIKAKILKGTYYVPTDWTVYVAFNTGYLDGNIRINSWVEEYVKADKTKIENDWAPTGTFYLDEEEIARLKAEKEAAEALDEAE